MTPMTWLDSLLHCWGTDPSETGIGASHEPWRGAWALQEINPRYGGGPALGSNTLGCGSPQSETSHAPRHLGQDM